MRKLFSILVALFATMSLLAHDFEIDKIYYNILSDTTVEVTYGGDSYWETYSADTIIIPSVVTYNGTSYSVVRIGSLAFYSCNISSITIPNSITSIGHNAFRYCRSLTTLIIPNGLESIEGGAFEECESLISITIPNSVTNIGGNAFYETGVYNDLSNWENDVLYIGDCLISTKTSISGAYEIKNQTRLIADGTFNECKSLTAITFPENVTSIGDITFWECSSLKSVIWNVKNPKNCGITFFNTPISSFIFGENVAYIPAGLCQSMKSLTSVIIPENVISIGDAAFYGCSSLTSITLPNSLTSIGSRAFDGCFSLASIIIPYSVTDIGDYAFSSCYFSSDNFTNNSSLNAEENYYWGARIFDADEVNGLFIQNDTIVNCRPYVDTITIPSTVKYIQGTPFSECWYRSSIVVESGNTIYDSRENCNAIIETATNTLILGCQNTIIPNTVTSIGDAAFYGCVSITSITIPRSVTSIGDYAFSYCSSLTSITIPESVITIGGYAFEGTPWYNSKEDGVIYIGKVLYNYKGEMPANTSLDIIEGTLRISSYAFSNCNNLTSIYIPNSVTSIGERAFRYCSSLTSITIPNSVISIGEFAFAYCDSLTSITIGESVTRIGEYAFNGCFALKSVEWNVKNHADFGWYEWPFDEESPIHSFTFGENVEYIPSYLCYQMDSLKFVTIPNNVDSIGKYAFAYCDSLTSVIIGNSVKQIGDNAFEGCSSLVSITIPETVMSIGAHAFSDCSSLASITIPESVTSVAYSAFAYCHSLKSVEWNAKNHADFDYYNGPFRGAPISSFTFGESVEYIPSYLCYQIDSLKSVTIPNNVDSIGEYAFAYCDSLTSVTIGNSVKKIGDNAFYDCFALKSVEWNVVNYADFINEYDSPFRGAPISSFTFGENVEYIPAYLCYDIDSLRSVTIPNSVDSIGEYAFAYCDSLTSVTIGESVTSIGKYTFNGCDALASITIPNNVKSIGYGAFEYNALKSVTLTAPTVEAYCKGRTNWLLDNSYCTTPRNIRINGKEMTEFVIPNTIDSIYDCQFKYCSSLTSVTIPNSVNSIGKYAFAYCDSLTSATIGNSVTSIGERAFYNCDSIKYIFSTPLLPPAIESNVFSSNVYDNAVLHVLSSDYKTHDVWKRFDSIQVADTIYSGGIRYKVITKSGELLSESLLTEESFNKFTRVSVEGDYTWRYDSPYGASMNAFQNETSMTLPNEDWFISPALDLEGCSSATLTFSHAFGPKAQVPTSSSQKAQYTIWVSNDFEGDVASATWTQLSGMEYGTTAWEYISSGNITIPTENLKANCRVAWKYSCTNASATWEIKNVSLSATTDTNTKPTLQVINGEFPYSGDIVIPSVVKYLNADLEVASIGNIAFRDCSSLNSVTIENGVTTIEEYAFSNSSLAAITLPNTLTSIGYSAFSGCSTLTSISIPNSVKNLGRSAFENCVSLTTIILSNEMTILNDNTFQDCSSLKSVKLGGKLTTIGEYVFSGCLKLNEISLPASITSISENAFATCTKLYDIYCYAMEPPTAYESSFANYNAFLHVPCDNQRVYLLDVIFGNFKYIECIEAETTPTDTVVVTPSFNDAEFIWPSNSSADSYTLAISKDGEVFCTLTFNANGQLTGIAFAPSRNGQHNAPAAVQAANGFTFTVTGLDEGSIYTYDLVIKDSEDNTLQSYSGEFRTQSVDDRIIMVEYDATQGEVIGAGTYLLGDIVTLTVIPNEGYQFATWGDGNTDNPRTLVVTQDTTLTAVFEILTYNVIVTCDPIHGYVTGSGTYNHGDVATLTATPSEGYTFVEWGDGCTDNPRALVVTQDTILTALFDVPTYNITVTCDPIHGYVTGSGTYNHGDVATLTATPSEGYTFVEWGDGCTDNPRALMVTQDTTLTAIFEILTYNVTVTYDPIHGSVTGSGTYNHGDVVTLTAIPNEGYQFVRWSNEVEDNPYTFVISDNVKLSAEFEAVIHSSVENTHSSSPTSSCQKIFRNGQLIIIRDGKTYNAIGQEM